MTERRGIAMAATLFVLTLVAAVTAFLFSSVITGVRTALVDYENARTFYAAEAGVEAALSQIEERLQDGALTDADLATIVPPVLDGFSFDGFEVKSEGGIRVETITDGPYAGLYGLTRDVHILSKAEDDIGVAAAIDVVAKARAIPLFQFGVFYDVDLEATNGPPMEFIGRVHSNGNIYLSSANAWYREPITTPKKVFHRRKDQNASLDGVYINDDAANEVQLLFDSEIVADFEAFKTRSCDDFDCRLQTDAFGVDPLRLPLPGGVTAYELLKPRDGADAPGARDSKFAWNADARVIVDLTDPQPTGFCISTDPMPAVTIERDGLDVPPPAASCAIFNWVWSDYYDGRESELKDVLNIDMAQLNAWVAGDTARQMELIYVEFILPPDIDVYNQELQDLVLDGNLDPAVRVVNGAELPNRLTVASEWPLYVLADYNAIDKKPAALVGDGITILSNAWLDDKNRPSNGVFTACDNNNSVSQGSPCSPQYTNYNWKHDKADETTVNAAFLAGHWATPCDWKETGCPTPASSDNWYGGGIENFPRFLEEWRKGSSRVLYHYRGALISPFTSEKTTGTWNSDYYVPPQRDWLFDTDFQDPAKLPPGTPNVGVVVKASFREAL